MSQPSRFVMVGAGFWAPYQLSAWGEHPDAQCVGIVDRDVDRAEHLAFRFGVPFFSAELEDAIAATEPDFLDIVTHPSTHRPLVMEALDLGIPVITQKPMAETWDDAKHMVQSCSDAQVPLLVHENWRWQHPLRHLHRALGSGKLGRILRARITFITGANILANQPYLGELEEYLLMDLGVHILDVARFLFGEAESLVCQLDRAHPHIKGEDMATVMLKMGGVTVTCEMAEAETPLRHDQGETFVFIEGDQGSLELGPGYQLYSTTRDGTTVESVAPPEYAWTHPDYALYQSAMVPCLGNLLGALRKQNRAETTGLDNLETLRLVHAAYQSAREERVVRLRELL
ncbi:MAG: Gfo/Idh/MocA family protein [Fimbriimonas sp.]